MISPLPGATTLKPGSATFPLPGIGADIVDDAGESGRHPRRRLPRAHPAVAVDAARHLGRPRALPRHLLAPLRRAGTSPATAPSATTTATSGCSAGSTTSCSSSGHNISTTEVESRARRPPRGRRGRGRRHDRRDHRPGDRRVRDPAGRQRADATRSSPSCATTSATLIGPIAKPKTILFTEDLPKTRSGKIMRRLLRDVAEDQALGDTTTLADPRVVDGIKARYLADRDRRRRVTEPLRGAALRPRALDLARRAGRARPRRRRRHRRRALRRRQPPALPRGAAPRLARVLRRVRRRPGDRGGEGAARPARPRPPGRAAHRPPAAGPPPHRGVAAPLRDPLGPAHHAAVGRLRAGPRLQAGVGVGAAPVRLRAAARDRGRPPQRRRCSARRASPASTSTPATTTDRSAESSRARTDGPLRRRRDTHRDATLRPVTR